jgi:rod shape-determining protein MreB
VPELAVSSAPRRKVLGVGSQARLSAASQSPDVLNPFAHPRSLVSDFNIAEQLVQHQLRKVLGNSFFSFPPYVVIHPLGSPAGGFTQIERRAFREMALGSEPAVAHVWSGRLLTDQEILTRKPPLSGGQWDGLCK